MSPDLHHLTGAYAVDALDGEERAAFERHLAECGACRAEVAELTATAHALGAVTERTPPASLRASVLSGIEQVRPLPPTVGDEEAEGARVVPFVRRTTTWLAAAAAAVVLAVGGVVWSPWSADEPSLTAVQQVEQAPDATTVTKHVGEATATLAYSRSLDRSALTVEGMPPAPSGKVYQLWYISADGARAAGFLTSGEDGRGEAALAGSLSGAQQVGVTVEPTGGSGRPTTQPVMVVTLA